jgi:hypothetical protein
MRVTRVVASVLAVGSLPLAGFATATHAGAPETVDQHTAAVARMSVVLDSGSPGNNGNG